MTVKKTTLGYELTCTVNDLMNNLQKHRCDENGHTHILNMENGFTPEMKPMTVVGKQGCESFYLITEMVESVTLKSGIPYQTWKMERIRKVTITGIRSTSEHFNSRNGHFDLD